MPHHLFGQEPDEVSPFHDEPDEPNPSEGSHMVFQNEPDEPDREGTFGLFKPEPDEDGFSSCPTMCFGDEPNEVSDSEESACLADDEMGPDAESTRGLVSLSFSTVTQFLKTQLCRSSTDTRTEQAKKKRKYNNSRRKADAEARAANKQDKDGVKQTRVPRNDPVPLQYICKLMFLFIVP